MGYEKSVIYKLQHEDGHFYIGSTYATLRERFRKHKVKSISNPDRRVYKHINGDWDKVRIVQVEECPCETKEQLVKKEDEHIQKELKNPLCLNILRAYIPDAERPQYNHERNIRHHQTHKEKRNEYSAEYNAGYYERKKEEIRTKQRDYYLAHREEIIAKNGAYRQSKKMSPSI